MDALKKNNKQWFSEMNDELWPGQCMSLQIEDIIYEGKSEFQDIKVLKSSNYGNVLVLDGVIQCTDRDEFAYQEMISFLPLNSHPNPEKVLIIGGGDGGVIREVVKHPSVKEVIQCEIDQKVIDISKKYLPHMSRSYSHPKLTTHIQDGFVFMEKHQGEFDVIITDSSDPVGPAESLFQKPYYERMKGALREGGIACAQGECMWLHLDLIKNMVDFSKTLYPVVSYGYTTIPTYPSGQIGFLMCSLNKETNFKEPLREFTDEEVESLDLKYYNPDIHRGAFLLPQFAKKVIDN